MQFAEQLGRVIGTVQARADGLLDRKALREQITSIRDAAADLLEQVADAAPKRGARRANAGKAGRAKGAAKAGARKAAGPNRGPVDAPGKRHRKPAPTARVKKSDERIAKLRTAAANRQRRGG